MEETNNNNYEEREEKNYTLGTINPKDIRLKKVKNMIFGLQGSGKTFCAKQLCKMQNLRVLVYSPHKHDFINEPNNFIYYVYTDFYADFERFITLAIELGKKGEIDLILVDEFDMLFKSGITRKNFFIDFTANHRHYNLGGLFLARRPQDIDASIVESCEFLIGYSIFGDNVKQKLNRIYKNYGDMVQSLKKGDHKAVVLEIGFPPRIMNKIGEY